MLNFFRKVKRFKVTKELLSIIPESQKLDPLTLSKLQEGDKIVICRMCKKVYNLKTWKHFKKCILCDSMETSKELIILFSPKIPDKNSVIEQPSNRPLSPKTNADKIAIIVKLKHTDLEISIKLPLITRVEDLIEKLIDENVIPKDIDKFSLLNENTGRELLYKYTFGFQGVSEGDTIIISPIF